MDTDLIKKIFIKMTEYENDPGRINHFVKVWGYSRLIGLSENISERMQLILEAAALTHDIGIKPSLTKYGSSAGKFQEKEGPPIAKKLLMELTDDDELIERVCTLIGRHHTYDNIDGIDCRILLEADFIVNTYEDKLSKAAVESAYNEIFKTKEGRRILREAYIKNFG